MRNVTKYRTRWVPLTAETRAIVERRLKTPGPRLFAPRWTSSQVRECMLRWCPKAGIEHVVIKDLRRTFCSWMAQAGVPELHVIRLMGHGSSTMVRRVYAHFDDSSFEHAVAALPSVADTGRAKVISINEGGHTSSAMLRKVCSQTTDRMHAGDIAKFGSVLA